MLELLVLLLSLLNGTPTVPGCPAHVPVICASPVIPAPTETPADAPAPAVPDVPAVSVESVALPSNAPTPLAEAAPDAPTVNVAPTRVAAAEPLLPLPIRRAASPPAIVVLSLLGVAAFGGALTFSVRQAKRTTRARVSPGSSVGVGAVALLLVPLLLAETTVYKLGLVLIVVVGAIGLHLLVNWAGELSLAHATLIGLPAFVVAKLSADHGLSPIALLPLAVVVGFAAGAVIGIPAIRARGLQVALVTLAAGVAIDRFFFTREWLVGDVSGARVSVPTLGPITMSTARSLYPVLWVLVIASVAVAWAIYRSKLGRGLLWVKAQPDAASAFGIPVGTYRTLAYVLSGGFAGLAGGLTAMWVQRLTPAAFPLSRSFMFLIIVAIAGRGFVGGVAGAAAFIEGGRLFLPNAEALLLYGAPIGLILTLTQHQAGLNGLGRQLKERIMQGTDKFRPRPLVLGGIVALAIGFGAIALAWYHSGNTSQVWIQNQELVSGGIGGLALVVLGIGLIITDRLTALAGALQRDSSS